MDNPAPNPQPLEEPKEGTEGLPVNAPEPPQEPSESNIDYEARLAALEEQNKKLQHRLTQEGRERKALESQQPTTADAEFDWNNPRGSIKDTVVEVFSEFEARQNQQREMDAMFAQKAEQLGITVPQLRGYYQELLESSRG
jgi:hypothetical protein